MHVRHIKSSTILVESGDVSVLCDPWILDGAFYGAWAHYPPVEFEPDDFDEIDYIYVSHIHPDHCHRETLERLDSDIPVLIHDYNWDFLRHNVEAAGFEVRELPSRRADPPRRRPAHERARVRRLRSRGLWQPLRLPVDGRRRQQPGESTARRRSTRWPSSTTASAPSST